MTGKPVGERVTVDELLDVTEELGFKPHENQDWWKIGDARGLRVYVKKAKNGAGLATEVHFSGFCVDDPLVSPLSSDEARTRHLGNVRGIVEPKVFKEAPRVEILRVFRIGLDELVESSFAALPRGSKQATQHSRAPHFEGTPVDVDERLLKFVGYGNLGAPLWLLGIEEGFGGRLAVPGWSVQRELEARAQWQPLQDARAAHVTLEDRYWLRRTYSRVWRNAAKLTRAIVSKASDWLNTDIAHDYVANSLGQPHGETLLGELFPLPAVGLHHWPYRTRWADREAYRRELWPARRKLWQEALASAQPRVVICYGTDVRPYARELFGCEERPGIYAHNDGKRRIIFAPFIGGRTSNAVLEAIVAIALR
jgi:hypothetical protein